MGSMNVARLSPEVPSIWSAPIRAVRTIVVIGQFICCGEGRSALMLPAVRHDGTGSG